DEAHAREATMRRARFTVGAAWGLLAVTASVGCASHNAAASRAALAATGSTSAARLEGVWEGEVWETPSYYNQGVRRIALKVSISSSSIASASAPIWCMPHSLKVRDEQLWATFETSFKGRIEAAMIGLYRAGRRVAEPVEAAGER